ncbi:hypothetical protein KIPE111705_07075 [Kibdelosporangium persicum]|uniref:hypothetical protein n=1 Tax=Kibdelosporangium persicum TaxID=2698649 RepID=UPI001563C7D2|nr:hypothetical protein [Kibdelosporangium persicum]
MEPVWGWTWVREALSSGFDPVTLIFVVLGVLVVWLARRLLVALPKIIEEHYRTKRLREVLKNERAIATGHVELSPDGHLIIGPADKDEPADQAEPADDPTEVVPIRRDPSQQPDQQSA